MVIKVNGDVMTVVANINYNQLRKAGMIEIKGEDKDIVYSVTTSDTPFFGKVGAAFTFGNAEGKAAMNIQLPEGATEETIVNLYAKAVDSLMSYEEAIVEALVAYEAKRAEIAAKITIE